MSKVKSEGRFIKNTSIVIQFLHFQLEIWGGKEIIGDWWEEKIIQSSSIPQKQIISAKTWKVNNVKLIFEFGSSFADK